MKTMLPPPPKLHVLASKLQLRSPKRLFYADGRLLLSQLNIRTIHKRKPRSLMTLKYSEIIRTFKAKA